MAAAKRDTKRTAKPFAKPTREEIAKQFEDHVECKNPPLSRLDEANYELGVAISAIGAASDEDLGMLLVQIRDRMRTVHSDLCVESREARKVAPKPVEDARKARKALDRANSRLAVLEQLFTVKSEDDDGRNMIVDVALRDGVLSLVIDVIEEVCEARLSLPNDNDKAAE